MNKIMKLVLSFLLFTLISPIVAAGNSVFIQQDNQEGQSIFIKQDGTGNYVGLTTGNGLLIDGNDLTVIIKQIGNSNTFRNGGLSFMGDTMTFDYTATGNSNKLDININDTDATGHYYDIDITGDSNIFEYEETSAYDVLNTNLDLDIRGDSNDIWIKPRGDGHFLYIYVNGDSNDIEFYGSPSSVGMNTHANQAIGPQVTGHGQFADDSGSEGATIDIYVIGNSNRVHTSSHGTGNYQVHDVIGESNILDVHDCCRNQHVRMVQKGDNNWMKTVTSGSNNEFTYYADGGNNKAYVYIYTSSAEINVKQKNGGNYAHITITGSSQYDYTLDWTQDGSDTCTYSYNRNNQDGNVTDTQSNGC